MYCPKCNSRLYPADDAYIAVYGACSYCFSFSRDLTLKEKQDIRKKIDKWFLENRAGANNG